MEGINRTTTQTVGIIRIVFIEGKVVSIESIQSVCRAEPHKSFTVLEDTSDRVLRKPLFNRDAVKPYIVFLGMKGNRQVQRDQYYEDNGFE